MKITPAMICDICLLVLLLLVVFRYMHRGFLSDIVNLLGSVVSIAGAMFVSHTYSEPIFDQLLRPGLEKSVTIPWLRASSKKPIGPGFPSWSTPRAGRLLILEKR